MTKKCKQNTNKEERGMKYEKNLPLWHAQCWLRIKKKTK